MKKETQPHIALVYQDPLISSTIVEGFEEVVTSDGLDVRVESIEFLQYRCGVEWLLPTAVVAYLAKPYFESFLKEMGKDHYKLLKRGLLSVRKRILEKYGDRIELYGSEGKLDQQPPNYSPVLSIEAESSRDFRLKLLIQSDIDDQEFDKALEDFLDLLLQEHGIEGVSASNLPLLEAKPMSRIVLVALDRDTGDLEVINVFDYL